MSRKVLLKDIEIKHLGLKAGNVKNSYRLNDEKLKELYVFRGYDEGMVVEALSQGMNPKDINHYWYKGEHYSLHSKKEEVDNTKDIEEAFERLLENYAHKVFRKRIQQKKKKTNIACKVTISDSHVGMNPNSNNSALFQYEYNKEIYNSSIDKVYNSIIKEFNTYGTFDLLLLDDLGDLADGWNGFTTRGGHDLPQNLTNAEVFETCVDAYVNLIRDLVESKVANKIILRCVCNDNHSGDFALIINKAIQKIINLMYSKEVVEVDILERFLEHRTYGDHCFILTHGKDKKQMKSGLPIILTDRAVRLITDYIEHYEINAKFIHVEKGDLHQIGYQRTKKFDYRNFMSFAPPSNWIQHNFGDSYSGYSIQIIPKYTNEVAHTDYFLDYKKIKK